MLITHTSPKIAVIGLGYVGLPLAVEFGKVLPVVGYDILEQRIEELRSGHDRTHEASMEQLQAATLLTYSSNTADLRDCNVFIVTVPTPVDPANRPDLSLLIRASQTVGQAMRKNALVIYESTVYPGVTEEVCVPVLEQSSGLQFNRDFYCGYSPERVNPGDKVNTLPHIRKITSGSTPQAADAVDELYGRIITAGTYKAPSIKVAEAAKAIENTQRDLNIALMNQLSVLFDRLNIDTLDVLEAAGSKWNFVPFRPGLVGGHCIGVDPYYLTYKAEQVGYHPQIILAGRRINDNMAGYAASNTVKMMLRAGMDAPAARWAFWELPLRKTAPTFATARW
jgi:UDP-N-acetyl-D-galactosamine dehydrogenase